MNLLRELDYTLKMTWFLSHRLRKTHEMEDNLFFGPIEIDKAHAGEFEKNKHKSKELKAGREGFGKTAVDRVIWDLWGNLQIRGLVFDFCEKTPYLS